MTEFICTRAEIVNKLEKDDVEAFLKEISAHGYISKALFEKLFKEGPEGFLKNPNDS